MMSTPGIGNSAGPENTSSKASNGRLQGDAIKRNKNLLLAVSSGLSLFLLLASWAWIVPPKSAPDDDFHLTTTWCAWGDSAYCIWESETTVRVPEQLIGLNCRNFDFTVRDKQCVWKAPFKFVSTDRFRQDFGYNFALFYQVQRIFVGDDIAASTLKMRLFNSALLSIFLGMAIYLAPRGVRLGLSLAWLVAATPLLAFTVASTTPQSWAVVGVAVSWVFFSVWLTSQPREKLRRYLALGAMLLTLTLAASARSDAALYILLSYLAVLVIHWDRCRPFPRRLVATIIPTASALIFAASIRISGGGLGILDAAGEADDVQWPLLLPMLADFPAFLAGGTGFFPASQVPWNGHVSWGLGWEGFPSPSMAYIPLLFAIAGLIMWGISHFTRRRAIGLAILILPLIAIPFITVWSLNFTSGVQLRYFIPLMLVILPFLLMRSDTPNANLSRIQLVYVGGLVLVGSVVAFTSAAVRYASGLTELWDTAWIRFWVEPDTSAVLPSVLLACIIGSIASVLFVVAQIMVARDSQARSGEE